MVCGCWKWREAGDGWLRRVLRVGVVLVVVRGV